MLAGLLVHDLRAMALRQAVSPRPNTKPTAPRVVGHKPNGRCLSQNYYLTELRRPETRREGRGPATPSYQIDQGQESGLRGFKDMVIYFPGP